MFKSVGRSFVQGAGQSEFIPKPRVWLWGLALVMMMLGGEIEIMTEFSYLHGTASL